MFPADRQPIPVYVWYDCRGQRARKWFDDGLKRPARSFFAKQLKAGKNPRVVRADPSRLFEEPQEDATQAMPD